MYNRTTKCFNDYASNDNFNVSVGGFRGTCVEDFWADLGGHVWDIVEGMLSVCLVCFREGS